MGFLEMLAGKSDEFMTVYYYARRPSSGDDGAQRFSYSRLDPYYRSYDVEFGQMRIDKSTYSLKTKTPLEWKVNGYVSTQDGEFFQITEIITDGQTRENEEALRLFKKALGREYTIRLLRVDNPWGIGK